MADLSILAGATSQSILVDLYILSTGAPQTGLVFNSSGLTAYYSFTGANATAVAITLATLAAITTAYSSGGFKEVDATNMPGLYRLDLPNAALATAKGRQMVVTINGFAGMAVRHKYIELTGWDNQDAVRGGMTALPNAAAAASGGLIINGSNAGTVTLAALTITAATTLTGNVSMAAGLNITQSSSNTSALVVTGNGTGHGAVFTSGNGATGDGVQMNSGSTNGNGLTIDGNGTGAGLNVVAGATGSGFKIAGGSTSGAGISITTTSGDGISVTPTAGNGLTITANGASKHGAVITGGTSGTCDGIKAVAGTGGVDIRGNITGNLTGTVSTVTTVTNQLTAAAIATGVWQDATAGDFTVASSIGKSLYTSGNAPGAASGLQICGSNAASTYASITCTGTFTISDGIVVTRSSSNTNGVSITGNGTGIGLSITAGATGRGVQIIGGGTSGDGFYVGATNGVGMNINGGGTNNNGVTFQAGTDGSGIAAFGAGTGDGIRANSGSGSTGSAISLTANSTNGDALRLRGAGTGAGLISTGGGTGQAIKLVGGATSGQGILITTTSGDGIAVTPTAGNALVLTANGTSKHGAVLTGGTAGTSDGMSLVAGTGGVSLRAPTITAAITGNITGNLSGSVGSVTGLTASNLDTTVSSRMATYTQPTGFLAATFPGTVASTTNITAGVITTATNLTNAPTNGDFTATMKTSIGTAVAASAEASVTGNVGWNVTGSVGSVVAAVTIGTVNASASNIKKNTALAGFTFVMTNATTGLPMTGLTVASQRSLNGAAFSNTANSVTEISDGWYTLDLAAADVNGNTVALKFTATGANDTDVTVITQP